MFRPSGLTALAVFNFIIGGWGALQALILLAAMGSGALDQGNARQMPHELAYMALCYLPIDAALLITSGIGYLKLKRFLGRWLGTADAAVSLVYFGVQVAVVSSLGYPFSLSALTRLVYPCLTLVLLNVVFRENLVS